MILKMRNSLFLGVILLMMTCLLCQRILFLDRTILSRYTKSRLQSNIFRTRPNRFSITPKISTNNQLLFPPYLPHPITKQLDKNNANNDFQQTFHILGQNNELNNNHQKVQNITLNKPSSSQNWILLNHNKPEIQSDVQQVNKDKINNQQITVNVGRLPNTFQVKSDIQSNNDLVMNHIQSHDDIVQNININSIATSVKNTIYINIGKDQLKSIKFNKDIYHINDVLNNDPQQKTNFQSTNNFNHRFNPLNNKKIQNHKFRGLILYHELPLKFYQKQIFQIKGKILKNLTTGFFQQKNQTKNNFITLVLRSYQNGEKFTYNYEVNLQNNDQFSVKIKFKNLKGKFYLALFYGTYGPIDSNIYEIVQQINQTNQTLNPLLKPVHTVQNIKINIENNKVTFNWDQNQQVPLNKITFIQEEKRLEFFLSNFQNQFQVDEADFVEFEEEIQIVFEIQTAYSSSAGFQGLNSQFSQTKSLTFTPCQHHFSQHRQQSIQIQDLPWRIQVNQSFSIQAIPRTTILNKILILSPNNTFRQQHFLQKSIIQIQPNIKLNKILLFLQPGVYIIQINRSSGGAALNRPIYVANRYPILPDLIDLSENQFKWVRNNKRQTRKQTFSMQEQLDNMLEMINIKRRQFNAENVELSQQLNLLALMHADDMINYQFFNHNNSFNQTPQHRAKNIGINHRIGQNIALDKNITQAHYKLCRSPIHLQNMVDENWQTVGIAIKRNENNGLFYVVQQFSLRNLRKKPLSSYQYRSSINQLSNIILKQNPIILGQNYTLSYQIKSFLQVNSCSIDHLGYQLMNLGINKFQIHNVRILYKKRFLERFQQKTYFKPKDQSLKHFSVAFCSNQPQYITIIVVLI